MKRKVLFLLIFCLLFISLSVNSFAVNSVGNKFYLHDMTVEAMPSSGSLTVQGNFHNVYCDKLNFNSTSAQASMFSSLPTNLLAGRTYVVEFKIYRESGSNGQLFLENANLSNNGLSNYSNFYTCLNLSQISNVNSWTTIQASFVYNPNLSVLVFEFSSNNSSTGFTVYISQISISEYNPNAQLESKIDEQNSIAQENHEEVKSGFAKIGQWFQDLIDSISQWFTDLGNDIKQWFDDLTDSISTWFTNLTNSLSTWFTNLTNNIRQFFTDLKDNISEFFTMLKNYLLYFQHPVTINSDGVPVDGNGEPVYTNPFADILTDLKVFFDDMFANMEDFITKIDESSDTISGYISIFTNAFERFGNGATIFIILIDFGLVFFVVRKIMGR